MAVLWLADGSPFLETQGIVVTLIVSRRKYDTSNDIHIISEYLPFSLRTVSVLSGTRQLNHPRAKVSAYQTGCF